MLINSCAAQTAERPHTYVSGTRPIQFHKFPDGSAYAVNAEHPSGVFYLRQPAAERLAEALHLHGNPPNVSVASLISTARADEPLLGRLLQPEAHRRPQPAQKKLNVWLHISNSCNLTCSYCYIPHLRKGLTVPAKETITSREVLIVGIRSLCSLCVERGFGALHLRFAGGEPLLAIDMIETACEIATEEAAFARIAVTFAMLTNGTLMSERFLQLLKRYKFRGLSISIDGMNSVHDEYRFEILHNRQRKGTWENIFRNIRVLKENGHTPYILTTLSARNYLSIDDFIETCVENKLGFRLSPIRDRKTAQIPGLQDAIVRKLEPIYYRLPSRLPITRAIQDFANFAEWSPGVKKSTACGTCRTSFAVGEHGDVSTCQMRLERSYGNIANSALIAFDRMRTDSSNWRFTRPQMMSGGCSCCMWRYLCSGGCPEHTMMAKGTYNSPSPWCKLYGDFLPIYFRSIAAQIKLEADRVYKV